MVSATALVAASTVASAVISYTVTQVTGLGSTPTRVAVDPTTATAYVTDLGSHGVSVIDEVTNTVTATIGVGSGPNGIAVDPTTHTLYVANGADDTVSVIDEGSRTVIKTIAGVGGTPLEIAIDPGMGRAYVADFGANAVSVIDEASNTVLTTVPVGTNPVGAAVDPATHTVYITNTGGAGHAPGGDSVSVIDEATNLVTTTIAVGVNPQSVAVDPTNHVVYVSNAGLTATVGNINSVSVIDGTTNTITTTIPVGTAPAHVSVDPAGHTAYVTNNGSNSVSVIGAATNTVTATVPVGSLPAGVAVDWTTHNVYVADQGGGLTEISPVQNASAGPPPPAALPHHSAHAGSNDPNPNTNPIGEISPDNATNAPAAATATSARPTVSTVCHGSCTLAATTGDEQVVITATDTVGATGGAQAFRAAFTDESIAPVFSLTLDGGGARPGCPGYHNRDEDWVQFGFRSGKGATFEKNATMTSRGMSRAEAERELADKQVCFEAPYPFATRSGFAIARRGHVFDGVLPDCEAATSVAALNRDLAKPCVTARQIVTKPDGWAVRLMFWVPPNRHDPKALG